MVKIGFASVCNEVNLREHLPLMPERVEVVSKQERNGLCELVLKDGGGYFTLYAGKDFVIAGAMISRGVNLSQESILRAQAEDIKKLLPELDKLASHPQAEKKAISFFTVLYRYIISHFFSFVKL